MNLLTHALADIQPTLSSQDSVFALALSLTLFESPEPPSRQTLRDGSCHSDVEAFSNGKSKYNEAMIVSIAVAIKKLPGRFWHLYGMVAEGRESKPMFQKTLVTELFQAVDRG